MEKGSRANRQANAPERERQPERENKTYHQFSRIVVVVVALVVVDVVTQTKLKLKMPSAVISSSSRNKTFSAISPHPVQKAAATTTAWLEEPNRHSRRTSYPGCNVYPV